LIRWNSPLTLLENPTHIPFRKVVLICAGRNSSVSQAQLMRSTGCHISFHLRQKLSGSKARRMAAPSPPQARIAYRDGPAPKKSTTSGRRGRVAATPTSPPVPHRESVVPGKVALSGRHGHAAATHTRRPDPQSIAPSSAHASVVGQANFLRTWRARRAKPVQGVPSPPARTVAPSKSPRPRRCGRAAGLVQSSIGQRGQNARIDLRHGRGRRRGRELQRRLRRDVALDRPGGEPVAPESRGRLLFVRRRDGPLDMLPSFSIEFILGGYSSELLHTCSPKLRSVWSSPPPPACILSFVIVAEQKVAVLG